jgi:hypothetical protein
MQEIKLIEFFFLLNEGLKLSLRDYAIRDYI